MNELLHTLFNPLPNAIMTVIMGIIALYWLFVMLGGAGLGDLDLGVDFDADVDVDTEIPDIDATADSDGDMSPEKSEGIMTRLLQFINVGKVPFMLVLSTLKFFTWMGSLITTQFIAIESWGWKSVLILIPLFIIGFFLTRYATRPMVQFFKKIGYEGEEEIDFLGRSGKMLSTIKDQKIGIAEFIIEKNPMKLNVISQTGEEIRYGDQVMVADESDDKKVYFVTKEITI